MSKNDLLSELKAAANADGEFCVKSVMVSDTAERERMQEASALEKDGFIILTRNDNSEMFDKDTPMVTLKGTLTDKAK